MLKTIMIIGVIVSGGFALINLIMFLVKKRHDLDDLFMAVGGIALAVLLLFIHIESAAYRYPQDDIYRSVSKMIKAGDEYNLTVEIVPDKRYEEMFEYKNLLGDVKYKAYLHQSTCDNLEVMDNLPNSKKK